MDGTSRTTDDPMAVAAAQEVRVGEIRRLGLTVTGEMIPWLTPTTAM